MSAPPIELKRKRLDVFRSYLMPSILGMLGTALYVLGDTMVVGRGLGRDGLAALNLSIPMINIMTGLGLLLGIGGSSLISISRGERREHEARRYFSSALILTGIVAIAFFTLTQVAFEPLLALLVGSSDQAAGARDYLGVILRFSPCFILFASLNVMVRNDGGPRRSMLAMLVSSAFNVILDFILIFPFQLGLRGGALATGLAQLVGLGILLTHFACPQTLRPARPARLAGRFRRIATTGFPSLLIEWSQGLAIFAFNVVILRLRGDLGVSSYGIVANLSLIFTAVLIGVSHGIQPLISYTFGARAFGLKRFYAKYARTFALVSGIAFAVVGQLFPRQLASIFVRHDPALIELTSGAIRLYFLGFLLMGVNLVNTIVLQSRSRVRAAFRISMLRGLLFVLLGLWLWPKLWGSNGVWLTIPLAELLTLVVSLVRGDHVLRVPTAPRYPQAQLAPVRSSTRESS